jgi:hypothetical protein
VNRDLPFPLLTICGKQNGTVVALMGLWNCAKVANRDS